MADQGRPPGAYRLFELRALLGFVATCNAGGANKWPAELNPHFQRLAVCILPDNDEAGQSHAQKTAEYFEDEDSFGRWLAECCVRDPMAHETTRDLYAAWTAWAERSGMSAGSEPKFRGALKARGFESKRLSGPNISGFVASGSSERRRRCSRTSPRGGRWCSGSR